MREIYLQSRLEMARTLHTYGVRLPHISVATGLTPVRLVTELNIADEFELARRQAKQA